MSNESICVNIQMRVENVCFRSGTCACTHNASDARFDKSGAGVLLFKILVESGTGGFFIPRLARLHR